MALESSEGPPIKDSVNPKLSRRRFLVGTAATLASAAITTIFGPTAKDTFESAASGTALSAEINRHREYIRQKYRGLEIDFGSEGGAELTASEKRDVLVWVREELAKYPPKFFVHFFTLRKIQIYNDISVGQDLVGGFVDDPVSFDMTNPAFRNVDKIVLAKRIGLLNFWNNFGWTNASFFKQAAHHELAHFTDFFSLVFNEPGGAGDWPISKPDDPFSGYIGDGYKSLLWRDLFGHPPGFIRAYGMKKFIEDRATVAEILLTDPKSLKEMAAKDPLLEKKMNAMKKRFYQISLGQMDEQYWQDLEQNKVKEGYWDDRIQR